MRKKLSNIGKSFGYTCSMKLDELPNLLPWLRYPLIAIIERQLLLETMRLIVTTQLEDDAPDQGEVPGKPGWNYQRAWQGYFVSHPDLPLSFDLSESEPFHRFSTAALFLEERRDGPSNDMILREACWRSSEWVPGLGASFHVLDELQERGALAMQSDGSVRLATQLRSELDGIDSLADSELRDRLFAEGDESERADWRAWLGAIARDPEHRALEYVHQELETDEVEAIVWQFLREPGDARLLALEVAVHREIDIEPAILNRLIREVEIDLDSDGMTIRALARHALPRGIAEEAIIDKLVRWAGGARPQSVVGGGELDDELREMLAPEGATSMLDSVIGLEDAAALLLEYAPERALPTVRRALREDSVGVLTMVGRLVALGQPWAIRELVEALPALDIMVRNAAITTLKSRGFQDAVEAIEAATPQANSSEMLQFMGLLGDEMAGPLERAMQSVATDEELAQGLDRWAERVRARMPDDFEPAQRIEPSP